MLRECEDCGTRYDDLERRTFCPHHPIDQASQGYCTRHAFFKPCPTCLEEAG